VPFGGNFHQIGDHFIVLHALVAKPKLEHHTTAKWSALVGRMEETILTGLNGEIRGLQIKVSITSAKVIHESHFPLEEFPVIVRLESRSPIVLVSVGISGVSKKRRDLMSLDHNRLKNLLFS
jgi:hypothetical protein